jgi:hypothetical protein
MSSETRSTATRGLSRRKSISSWFNLSTANTDHTTSVSANTGTEEHSEGTQEVGDPNGKLRHVRQGLSRLLHHRPWSMFKRSEGDEGSKFESMTRVSDRDHEGPALQPSNKTRSGDMSRGASQLTIRMIDNDGEEQQSPGKKTTKGDTSMEIGVS